jgi:hypothetical protein
MKLVEFLIIHSLIPYLRLRDSVNYSVTAHGTRKYNGCSQNPDTVHRSSPFCGCRCPCRIRASRRFSRNCGQVGRQASTGSVASDPKLTLDQVGNLCGSNEGTVSSVGR